MRVADIRWTPARRVALAVSLPALMMWYAPTLVFDILREMLRAAREEFRFQCGRSDILLLRRGFAMVWDARWPTDPGAALADAKKIGR